MLRLLRLLQLLQLLLQGAQAPRHALQLSLQLVASLCLHLTPATQQWRQYHSGLIDNPLINKRLTQVLDEQA